MAALLYRLRSELRRRWRAWLLPALLIGLTAGSAIAAASGARRTETAYDRFLEKSRASDVLVASGVPGVFDFAVLDLDRLTSFPEVEDSVRYKGVGMLGETDDGQAFDSTVTTPFMAVDDRYLEAINRPRYLDGGPAKEANELVLSFVAAERLGLDVGDRVRMGLASEDDLEAIFGTGGYDVGLLEKVDVQTFQVAGIAAVPGEFEPLPLNALPSVHLPAATARIFPDAYGVDVAMIRLKPGTESRFLARMEEMAGGDNPFFQRQADRTETARRAFDVYADALWLLAALVAAAGAVLTVQAIARQTAVDSADTPILAAAGMTRRQLVTLPLLRAALIAVVASALAFGLALALSPLTPLGDAAKAEPDPGVWIDGGILALGILAIFAVTLIGAALAAARVANRRRAATPAATRSSVRGDLVGTGLPATVAAGVRFALHRGSGTAGVPVLTAVSGIAVGLATVVGALTFANALDRLVTTPERYGWNWDVQIGDPFTPNFASTIAPKIARLDGVSDVAVGTALQVEIKDERVDLLATAPLEGQVEPTLLEGEPAIRDDEIVLGTRTMRDLGVDVGDTVTARFGGRSADFEVVGRGVFPSIGSSGGLGRGGMLTFDAARTLAPGSLSNVILIRGDDDGINDVALEAGAEVREGTYRPEPPRDLENFTRIDSLPAVVGAIMAVVAIACVGHALVTSVRRRRRDLAVLKTLGFVRRQVAATVAWQATTLGAVALPFGLVLGVIGGRLAWLAFAQEQGVADDASYPVLLMVLAAAGALVLVNLVAAAPAWAAGRTRPAAVFRSE